jgi:hypothetical protein
MQHRYATCSIGLQHASVTHMLLLTPGGGGMPGLGAMPIGGGMPMGGGPAAVRAGKTATVAAAAHTLVCQLDSLMLASLP